MHCMSRHIGTVIAAHLPSRVRTKPGVAATIVFGVSFLIELQVAMTTCTNPSSGVTVASTWPSTKSGPERMAT